MKNSTKFVFFVSVCSRYSRKCVPRAARIYLFTDLLNNEYNLQIFVQLILRGNFN